LTTFIVKIDGETLSLSAAKYTLTSDPSNPYNIRLVVFAGTDLNRLLIGEQHWAGCCFTTKFFSSTIRFHGQAAISRKRVFQIMQFSAKVLMEDSQPGIL